MSRKRTRANTAGNQLASTEIFILSQLIQAYHLNSSPEFGPAKALAVSFFFHS